MVKSLTIGVFGCLEYAIVLLFIASLAFTLIQGLDVLVPEAYDSSAEEELAKAVREGFDSKQITSWEAGEIWRVYRDDQARVQRRRAYILYTVSICVSAGLVALLFKKYRSLRFRERFRDYLFPAKT